MRNDQVTIHGVEIDVWSLNTAVVGSGAAGFNAADHVAALGQEDVAILTEGVKMGTSRNTGSDKQTYFKLTLSGDCDDNIAQLAQTLFDGGARHGDIALVEAALSTRCFYKLVEIGVDFPHNRYGEYIGYKTDHDSRQRAISIGPYTSRAMTEKLEKQVCKKGVRIFDHLLVIGILTDGNAKAVGLIGLDLENLSAPNYGIKLFNCTNIIYATGGPATLYEASVYPKCQTGASGIAFAAGVKGVNLTESQYGLASIKFRWNLSGSYQQVIPRYLSTDQEGNDEQEFLNPYFPEPGLLATAIFLKGYQWPFDPRKIENYGSSLIDLLVYHEINHKERRVFLDFTTNPSIMMKAGEMDFSVLSEEAYDYLYKSDSLFGTPIDRLCKMNLPAFELYKENGIDLTKEKLEIAVCAQHNNGGLIGDDWWESNVAHFFPIGEANGSAGVYRPGGSALNAAQVGGLRAAQYIAKNYGEPAPEVEDFLETVRGQVEDKLALLKRLRNSVGASSNLQAQIAALRHRMTKVGAHVRNLADIEEAIRACHQQLKIFPEGLALLSTDELANACRYYDLLITQFAYLSSMKEYAEKGGGSRGSYLIVDAEKGVSVDGLPKLFQFRLDDGNLMKWICETQLEHSNDWRCYFKWVPVRPIPQEESWFEKLWGDYRSGEVWRKE